MNQIDLVTTSTESLLSILLFTETEESLRIAVLFEVLEREEADLAKFVIRELKRELVSITWKEALISAAPRIIVSDRSLRISLAQSLWSYILSNLKTSDPEKEKNFTYCNSTLCNLAS